jgi:hypothetical protein
MFGSQQPMYGNPYPQRYPQQPVQGYYQQPMAAIPQQQVQPEGLIRVTGVEGARAYPVAPNSTVPLFDADRDVLYVKSADAGGFPTIRAFAFSPLQDAPQQQPEYVTRQEFNDLKEMIANGKHSVWKAAKPATAESDE